MPKFEVNSNHFLSQCSSLVAHKLSVTGDLGSDPGGGRTNFFLLPFKVMISFSYLSIWIDSKLVCMALWSSG